MKKSHKHDEMSGVNCAAPNCTKKIKQRLIDSKDNVIFCYKHYGQQEAKRGHHINTAPREKRVVAGLPVKTFK